MDTGLKKEFASRRLVVYAQIRSTDDHADANNLNAISNMHKVRNS